MIGAGLRAPEQLLLFEKLINVVHAPAAGARICFNTTPADTAEAVQRWVEPIAGPDARFERKPAGRGDLRRHGAGLRDGEKGIDDDLHHGLGLACVNQSADGFNVFIVREDAGDEPRSLSARRGVPRAPRSLLSIAALRRDWNTTRVSRRSHPQYTHYQFDLGKSVKLPIAALQRRRRSARDHAPAGVAGTSP